jgi:hypothetical protein
MMDNGKLEAAVYRYQAMAGLKQKLPPKAARRAREDRKRYAEEYVLQRKGKTLCDPVRMVRFLVDVCGLTMQEASKAVRAALRSNQCGAWPAAKSVEGMAEELYRRTGDMADAMSMARFLGWSSDRRIFGRPCACIWPGCGSRARRLASRTGRKRRNNRRK